MPKAILLDLDDTLILEVEYVRSGYSAVSKVLALELGCDPSRIEVGLWGIFSSGERAGVLSVWLDRHGRSDLIDVAIGVYRDHLPSISPVAGWDDLITRWREVGIRLGIVTDGRALTQRQKLKAIDADRLVDAIVVSDELKSGRSAWKPSPEPYLECLRRLGVTADHAIYIGDNPVKDFLGARRAGMEAIRLALPGGLHTNLAPPSSDHAPRWCVTGLPQLGRTVDVWVASLGAGR